MFRLRLVVTENVDVAAEAALAAQRAAKAMGNKTAAEIVAEVQGQKWEHLPAFEVTDPPAGLSVTCEVAIPGNTPYHWVDDGTAPVSIYKPVSREGGRVVGGMVFRFTGVRGRGINYAPKSDGRAGQGDARGQIGPKIRTSMVNDRSIAARDITGKVIKAKADAIVQAGQDAI